MDGNLQWAIGLTLSVVLFLGGIMATAFRNLSASIAKTHARIDTVKDTYARRDDLEGHLNRIDKTINDLKEDLKQHHEQVLNALLSYKQKP